MKQHTIEVDIENLGDLPVKPPRKRLWDLLPKWFCEFWLTVGGYSPKPTPYEVWLISNIVLRAKYKSARLIMLELAGQMTMPQGNAPGSKELN